MSDMVNSPAHYADSEIESRDHSIDAVEDLKKSIWYTRFALGDDPRKDDAEGN